MSTIKRIEADQLRVGMYVTQINDEWAVDAGLKAQGLVTRQATVDQLRSMGMSQFYIDVSKGEDCEAGIPLEVLARQQQAGLQRARSGQDVASPRVPYERELKSAHRIRKRARSLITSIMSDVKMGRSFDTGAVEELALDITDSLFNNQNALLGLLNLRHKDDYLLEHSMNVAVLMGALARSMGYQGKALQDLVLGGFLHDVGKIRVDDSILHKPGRLDPGEWEEMKRHVQYGLEALQAIDGLPQTSLDICGQHHERLDGTGYPAQLPQAAITLEGRLGAVVDVYDAITADRVYHAGMLPTLALRKMLEWSDSHLDKQLVYQLIRCVGVYPAGTMVLLGSDHVALVQETNPQQPARPRVQLVYDIKRRAAMPPRVVSLADSEIYGEVKSAVDPAAYGLTLSDYLQPAEPQ